LLPNAGIVGNLRVPAQTQTYPFPDEHNRIGCLLSCSEIVMSAIPDPDPLAPALARNEEHREMLLRRAGGALSAEEAARSLEMTREAVDEWRRAGLLLAIPEGSDWRYPACQFQQSDVVPGLAEVVRGLAAAGPWVTLDFLLAPDTVLGGRTPLQALRKGDRDAVLRLVRASRGDGFG
jgi:hypothetical protein